MNQTTTRRTRVAAVPLCLALLLGGAACTADEPESSGQQGTSGSAGKAAPPVQTVVSVGEVTGGLEPKRRARVKARVGEVVDRWLDRAYVGGKYPRRDFGSAFAGFTRGAAAEARRDRALMSNQQIGGRVESVRATNRRLRIDVLASRGKAVGVTARVILDFATKGKVQRSERVSGRLYLTWRDGWKVFAYDVTRGVHQKPTSKQQKKQQEKNKQQKNKQQRKAA